MLGQTYPYHNITSYNNSSFPVTELVFDKDRKPWGTSRDATALLMLSMQSKTISVFKNANGIPVIQNNGVIEPVFHEEGRSMDD